MREIGVDRGGLVGDLGRGGLVGDLGRVLEREEACRRRCRGRERTWIRSDVGGVWNSYDQVWVVVI